MFPYTTPSSPSVVFVRKFILKQLDTVELVVVIGCIGLVESGIPDES